MFTKFIQRLLRGLSVAVAGTVAAVMFGPTLAANAATYFRHPVRTSYAVRDTDQRRGQQKAIGYQVPKITPADVLPVPSPAVTITLPFATSTPTTSSITITPIMEATATPGVSPTAAAADSAPVPSVPDSPVAVATTDTPVAPKPTVDPTPTQTAPKPTAAPTKTATPTPVKTTPKPTTPVASVVRAAKVAAVLAFARAQLGERYVMGGMGPNTWDCSGLTKAALAHVGINIGTHSSNNQYQTAKSRGQLVPFSEKKAGDLVFYGTPGNIYHVAIYSGNGRIIEAANPARPVLERAYWGTPYRYVARVIK